MTDTVDNSASTPGNQGEIEDFMGLNDSRECPADGTSLKQAALDVARRGFPVFPVAPGASCPPLIARWPERATTDPARIAEWWDRWPEANPAVHVGGADLVVIDLDVKGGKGGIDAFSRLEIEEELSPDTFTVDTPSGGRHLYFKANGHVIGNSVEKIAPGVDIRAGNGYVVAPGAVTGKGRYTVRGMGTASAGELPELPGWIAKRAGRAKGRDPDMGHQRVQVPVDGDRLRALLHDLPPNINYEQWATVARSLRTIGEGGPNGQSMVVGEPDFDGKELFCAWSAGELCPPDPSIQRGCQALDGYAAAEKKWGEFGPVGGNPRDLEILAREYTRQAVSIVSNESASMGRLAEEAQAAHEAAAKVEAEDAGKRGEWYDPETGISWPRDVADLFRKDTLPLFPHGVFPKAIEDFALFKAKEIGGDAMGFAMSALAVCAAASDDAVQVRVRPNGNWLESARIWVMLVGDPSTKKSPMIREAIKPLSKADAHEAKVYKMRQAIHNQLPKEERAKALEPSRRRCLVYDATVEELQRIMSRNPRGLLFGADEISGWFSGMGAYKAGKGKSKDRAFWLTCFNGDPHTVDRVGAGTIDIPNASACLLGGIQPDVIRGILADADEDGLLQRMFPIPLQRGEKGMDIPDTGNAYKTYCDTVDALLNIQPLDRLCTASWEIKQTPKHFDPEAQHVMERVIDKHHDMVSNWQDAKLQAVFGKYDGLFARLCLLFHLIENASGALPPAIPAATAERVERLLHGVILPYTMSFYKNTLDGIAYEKEAVAVAEYILANGLEKITARDLGRACRALRGGDKDGLRRNISRYLEIEGWLQLAPSVRHDSLNFHVNPLVHEKFKHIAEVVRREKLEVHRRLQRLQRP